MILIISYITTNLTIDSTSTQLLITKVKYTMFQLINLIYFKKLTLFLNIYVVKATCLHMLYTFMKR